MLQFTETSTPLLHHNSTSGPFPNLQMNKSPIHRTSPWPGFPTSKSTLGSFGDANSLEQLLVQCANAIESNDATLAQQILWVLNNIASPDGDSNQRLTCSFLRALISRAARSGSCKLLAAMDNASYSLNMMNNHRFSVIELASFIDLTPWHRFGFTAANAAILEAVDGFSVIHIVDLSLTHCMQIPTLIDAIANRFKVPPFVKLSVPCVTDHQDVPPMLDLTYGELGSKLVTFAQSRNIILEFRAIPSSYKDGFSSLIEQLRVQHLVFAEHRVSTNLHEALVINSHMKLHHIPEDQSSISSSTSLRTMFLKAIRSLDPTVVILVDEDADLTSNNLVCRLRSAFNYLWIPYDTMDTFLPKGSKQREWYEADICWKIENVIANEGVQRVERVEPKNKWCQRMRSANFRNIGFGEEAVSEVKRMLDEHSAGWGLKGEDEHLLLTWKGHNVVFATVWIPA